MAGEIQIDMNQEFANELNKLAAYLRAWGKACESNLIKALKAIAYRFKSEAVKRVPVDMGNLKNRILSDVYKVGRDWIAAVGTNVPYGKFLEFGTKYIAGGRVQSLGEGIEITDAQAITDWPAKDGGIGAAKNHPKGGSSAEQMPWLRPAFNAIKSWAVAMLIEAAKPPNEGKVA